MIKDLYPISKIPFEQFLVENDYSLNDINTWKKFIHSNYCIHLEKRRKKKNLDDDIYEPCRRKKILGKEYCSRHAPKDEIIINKCNYNGCKKSTKLNQLCYIHKKQFNNICNIPLPLPSYEENIFYGHNIYKCIVNKNTKIFIKDYIYDGKISNNKKNNLIKYNYFSLNNFLYNIYNSYNLLILHIVKKYNINIEFLYILLKLIDEINKNDKKVSILSNSNVNISNKKKKDIVPYRTTNENKVSQIITKTLNTEDIIIQDIEKNKYLKDINEMCDKILSINFKKYYFYKNSKKDFINEINKYRNDKINFINYLNNNDTLSPKNIYNEGFFVHLNSLPFVYFKLDDMEIDKVKCDIIDIIKKYYIYQDLYTDFSKYCIQTYNLFISDFNPFIIYKLKINKKQIYLEMDNKNKIKSRKIK